MSKQLKSKCPICGGYLFDDDDIVYCPECGAPHHRDCWKSVGHCGLEKDHGTDREYKPENTEEIPKRLCKRCGKELPGDSKFCPYCGLNEESSGNPLEDLLNNAENDENSEDNDEKNVSSLFNATLPEMLGGVDKNEKIDGIGALQLAKFILFMPNRMLPKFKRFQDSRNKASWNWAAFFSPYTQAFFRKMDFVAVLYLLVEIAAYVLLTPLFYAISGNTGSTTMQISQSIINGDIVITSQTAIFTTLGMLLLVGMRVFAGLFNDYIYKRHVIKTIKSIRADLDADDEEQFRKKGGVRPFLAMGFLFVWSYLSSFLPAIFAELLF